jgi:hypothetical protein
MAFGGEMDEEDEPELIQFRPIEQSALEYLQAIYRDPTQSEVKRMRAAALALPYESPRLNAIAHVTDDGTFGERLDRALERSELKPKLIEHRPQDADD